MWLLAWGWVLPYPAWYLVGTAVDAGLVANQGFEALVGHLLSLCEIAAQIAHQDRFDGPIVSSETDDGARELPALCFPKNHPARVYDA
jgi:hypothetical protein